MKKLLCTVMVLGFFQLSVSAQPPARKQTIAGEGIKTALISKLSLSEQAADKIIAIENEFYASAAAADVAGQRTEKARLAAREKVQNAHVVRRSKLVALPLTPRQMEDVISLSEAARSKPML